jgi:hypothetical protein
MISMKGHARQSEAAGAHMNIGSGRQASVDAALDLLQDATGPVRSVSGPEISRD